MYLYGTGGIAIVAAEVLLEQNIPVDGFYDDDPQRIDFLGKPVYPGLSRDPHLQLSPQAEHLVCIGNNRLRQSLVARLDPVLGTAIHPSALVSRTARIGAGTLVFQGSRVQAAARLGRAVIVNTGGSIDHECVIGDFAHVAPNVTLCGYVQVGEGANIGAGSVVIPSVRIGRWATVGAGTVVIRDVPDHAVVVGNPARIIRYESDCPAPARLGQPVPACAAARR